MLAVKLFLTLLFAIGFALVFERRRVSAFLRERNVRRWSRIGPDLLERLYLMREALQDEQGRIDLVFEDVIEGRKKAFLFSGANGWLQLRISGQERRYRLAARDRTGPLWLDVSPPMRAADEPGPDDEALWDYGRPEEGWTSAADASAGREGVALAEAFLRIWHNHVDPAAAERRRAEWRATIARIDRAALDKFVLILARDRASVSGMALKAIEAQWEATAADWRLIPANDGDRDRHALRLISDGLGEAGVIAALDFKDYDADHVGPILLAGLPFADALIAGLSNEGDFFDRMKAFDVACQRHGHRLVTLDSPYDDYDMAVVAARDIDDLNASGAKLGLRPAVTADHIDR